MNFEKCVYPHTLSSVTLGMFCVQEAHQDPRIPQICFCYYRLDIHFWFIHIESYSVVTEIHHTVVKYLFSLNLDTVIAHIYGVQGDISMRKYNDLVEALDSEHHFLRNQHSVTFYYLV